MKKLKLMSARVFAVITSAAITFSSFAGTRLDGVQGSWKNNEIGWWWENADSSYPVNQWVWLDGKWYHVDPTWADSTDNYGGPNLETKYINISDEACKKISSHEVWGGSGKIKAKSNYNRDKISKLVKKFHDEYFITDVNFQSFCATSDGLWTTKRANPLENTGKIRILGLIR